MNRLTRIYVLMGLCGLLIATHIAGVVDFGALIWGLLAVLVMLSISLTLAIAAEKKDEADG